MTTSHFESSAKARGYNANLIISPDPSEKIRRRGLEQLEGQGKVLDYINRQAEAVANHFEKKNKEEHDNRQQNFETKVEYANQVAAGKWKNFQTTIESHKIKGKDAARDREALLKLIPSGIKLVQGLDARRKQSIDNFAANLYRDYGLGFKQYNALLNAHDEKLKDSTSLQGFLREIEMKADTPMHIIERIRRGNGYLPIAIEKLSAQRWGQQLIGRIGARANDDIGLPGYPNLTLNTAKGETYSTALNELISQELTDPQTGQNRFSNRVMQLAGLNGPEGLIAKATGYYERRHAEATIKDSEADRYEETITIIQSFIGPGDKGGEAVGPQGIQRAIEYFAGHSVENPATGVRLRNSRNRVTDAIVQGLKSNRLSFEEVEDLGDLRIYPKGVGPKGVLWKDHFEKEWNTIKEAAVDNEKMQDQQQVLANAQQRRLGREAYESSLDLVRSGNADLQTLLKLDEEFKAHGPSHEKARQVIARAITYKNNSTSVNSGKRFLIEQSKNNVVITDEMIDNLLLPESAEAFVRTEAAKHNRMLPQGGKEGHEGQLKYRIEGELQKIIEKKSGWQNNPSHQDAGAAAYGIAAGHYRTAKEMDYSDQKAYEYARDMITKDIRDPDGQFRAVDNGDGTQSFAISKANLETKSLWTPDMYSQIAEEVTNSDAMYTKQYIPVSTIEAFSRDLNRGKQKEMLNQAITISNLSRGKFTPVEFLQAQTQLAIDSETRKKGSSNIQPIPDWYVKSFEKELEKIPQNLRRYLTDDRPVKVNQAYTSSGYQPPIQEPYYAKIRPLVKVGDPNAVVIEEGKVNNSWKKLKFDVTDATIREVLQLMENGHFSKVGEGLWDHDTLMTLIKESGTNIEDLFDADKQQELIDITIKTKGMAGFPHVEFDDYGAALIQEVNVNLNEEKVSSNYWRSMSACNEKACRIIQEEALNYA